MATCENGHQVRDGAQFCGVCGADLQVVCAKGHRNILGTRFCEKCGAIIRPEGSTDALEEGTALVLASEEPVASNNRTPETTVAIPTPSPAVVPAAVTPIAPRPATDAILARSGGGASAIDVDEERSPRRTKKWLLIGASLILALVVAGALVFAFSPRHPHRSANGASTTKLTRVTTTTAATSAPVLLGAWGAPTLIDSSGELDSVSCASPAFCMAVDTSGNMLSYDGTAWESLNNTGSELGSVSCVSSTDCEAVGTGNTGGDAFAFDGSSWSSGDSIDPGYRLHSISCASPTFCVAGAAVNVLNYDGASWSSGQSIDPGNSSGQGLPSVSCPASSFCVAVDAAGNAFVFNGSTWTTAHPLNAGVELTSVSCPTTTFCAAVDANGNVYSYDGTEWSSGDAIDSGVELTSVSCPATTFCAAVDASGNVETFNGTTWGAPQAIDTGGDLTSISCPSTTFCVAVDSEGNEMVAN